MSHLRAPAARADRREGGRHGRPVARAAPSLPETHIRPQLLRLALLPPVAVALSASAALLFAVRTTAVPLGPTFWIVLGGAVGVALAGIVIASVAADRAAKSISDRIGALRRTSARGQADLLTLVEALRRGDGPPARRPRSQPTPDADDFDLLADDLARAHDGAVGAVVQASQLSSHTGNEQKVEVFVNLARRLQSLVHREISILDELENEIEDPDLLKGLFHVDHLATRIRRHAENLAVLGGAVSRRQWSNPVSMTEVLRSAIAEVEQYSRVKLVPPIDGTVRGHAVADVIHLLAELVENATVFSAPHTQVLLRANVVTSGLAVEVEDRGLGMPLTEQHKMNALLADPDQVNVASLLQDGRIGLFVVSQLARRHGIAVRLQTNIYGGVQAVLVVPQALLGAEEEQQARAGQLRRVPQEGASAQGAPVQGVPVPGAPARGAVTRGTLAHGASAPGATGHGPSTQGTGVSHGMSAHSTSTHSTSPHTMSAYDTSLHGTPGHDMPAHGSRGHGTPAHGTPVPAQGVVRSAAVDVPRLPWQGAEATPSHGVPIGSSAVNGNAGPAPLPMRGAGTRSNPAEAVPGIHPDDRRIVMENLATPPAPRSGTVRGTMGKPQLPKRRAQEHIVPELRGGPAPRQDSEIHVGHDPGLMAAFQRGIGLAEAQFAEAQYRDTGYPDPVPTEAAHMDGTPIGETHTAHTAQEASEAHAGRETAPAPGHDLIARHDGSTPAG
ncbi:ATP-binding protein [Streptomyces sp. NPDC050704]|uniref:sensor histidine kinase n=1 Tax=Streptomyces sp. NPDC050704 TaxID=3157219 RepID=UPI003430B731